AARRAHAEGQRERRIELIGGHRLRIRAPCPPTGGGSPCTGPAIVAHTSWLSLRRCTTCRVATPRSIVLTWPQLRLCGSCARRFEVLVDGLLDLVGCLAVREVTDAVEEDSPVAAGEEPALIG